MTKLISSLLAVAALSLLSACTDLSRPSPAPTGDEAPLNLRQLQIQSIDGHAALLLHLSHRAYSLRHVGAEQPGRIMIEATGPVGDGDLEERSLGQSDALIADVRVARTDGVLKVVIMFYADEPPEYSVHEMADWLMVRLGPASS
jgi:hypothetical protein